MNSSKKILNQQKQDKEKKKVLLSLYRKRKPERAEAFWQAERLNQLF